jgi:hypothetical protein
MVAIITIGCVMIGINILFSWLELQPFLKAIGQEAQRSQGVIDKLSLTFRLIGHLPKLWPTICDLGGMIILTHIFNLGAGFAGGIAGLFASNLLSILIYYQTHWKNKLKRVSIH